MLTSDVMNGLRKVYALHFLQSKAYGIINYGLGGGISMTPGDDICSFGWLVCWFCFAFSSGLKSSAVRGELTKYARARIEA